MKPAAWNVAGPKLPGQGDPALEFGHFGLASWGIPAAPANREAPKARIIPAQPSGLGNRTCEAKALKARSISIPGLALVEFGPMPWRQQPVFFWEILLNGSLARCGTSILRDDLGNWAAPLALGFVFGDP